jgi:hypothetical protein
LATTVALGEVMLAATATYAAPPPEPNSRDVSKRTVQEDTTSGLSRPDHNKGLGAPTGIGKVADWITNEELEHQAKSLEGATMPNGQKYESWLKSKGSGDDGENTEPS